MSPHPSSEGTDSLTTREGEGGVRWREIVQLSDGQTVDAAVYQKQKAMFDALAVTAVRRGRTAIVWEEPEDPDVLAVRAILHAYQRAMAPPDSGWGNMSYLKGSYDSLPCFLAALRVYKALSPSAADTSSPTDPLREASEPNPTRPTS